MKIFDILKASALAKPDSVAAVHLDNRISFGDLYQKSCLVADYLSGLKLQSGARVGLMYENTLEYIYLYFGIFGADLVPVPLDTSLKADRLNLILGDCGPEALIMQDKFFRFLNAILDSTETIKQVIGNSAPEIQRSGIGFKLLDEIIDQPSIVQSERGDNSDTDLNPANSSNELAAIFYTSGSTGEPKGVMLSHRNLISNTYSTVEYLKLKSDDSVLVILPFYYIYGNSLLLTHIAAGGAVVIDNRFMYPEVVLKTMEKEKVTGFSGVPSNFMILLNKSSFPSKEFPSLRYFTQAGGAMAPDVIKKLIDAFPNKETYIMYGQTEASPRVSYLPPERLREKLGSIGIPVPGVKIMIMNDDGLELPDGEPGELAVAGDNVMLGYWNRDDEENEVIRDGVLYTGDLARKDSDGYVYIIGRKKEIIKTGGNRVSAKEVEERILAYADVVEAAVIGVGDDLLGEAVKAIIVPKSGVEITAEEIKRFCAEKLAEFKVPKIIEFKDSLPKYKTGKIDKVQLAKK